MISLSKGFQDCQMYLRGVRGYADATLANYGLTWSQFLGYLREQGLGDEARHFNVENVMGFCDWLARKGAIPNTILNKIHGLSTLARFLMKRTDGRGKPVLASNPTTQFERPRGNPVETKFLLPDELAQFMAVPCHEGLALARTVMLDTGIRCLEAIEATVGDLRAIGDSWYLVIPVKGRRQAGAEPATIPISLACAELLLDRVRGKTLDEPLFPNQHGKPFTRSQLGQAMARLGRKAGITRISTSPHKLRHTANVLARMGGADAFTRQKMLNHKSARTLARYDHLVPGEVVKGREQQAAALMAYLAQAKIPAVDLHCGAPLRLTPETPVPNPAN